VSDHVCKLLTSVGVELGVVQVLDNLLDGLDGAVPVVRSDLSALQSPRSEVSCELTS
jgi:hypothetical protein